MSWVIDIILIFSLDELFDDEECELEVSPALENINNWLSENGKGKLESFSNQVYASGKTMQSCVYLGAFNYLDINSFREVVESQNWRNRNSVQLLIQNEQDEVFSMYMLGKDVGTSS